MMRLGQVIRAKPEHLERYKQLHSQPWPQVNEMIKLCNIQNYSIFYRDGYLFSYYEYTGDDYEADMIKMAADPVTKQWWELCRPCQEPLVSAKEEEWWSNMDQVYFLE